MDSADDLEAALLRNLAGVRRRMPNCRRLLLGLSGGIDSVCLLHALKQTQPAHGLALGAIHVDHGLQPGSADWGSHCAALCAGLAIDYRAISIAGRPAAGASREAWAREVRYAAFETSLADGDLLLTAHHADDQAETFLLQALRGAGPHGLRGIAPLRRLGSGWLLRPLLGLPRAAIEAYAKRAGLRWIEDPSNADRAFDRNYLRHEIMPALARRWPRVRASLARVAEHQGLAAAQLDEIADRLIASAGAQAPRVLPLGVLADLEPELQGLVLRRWIRRSGFPPADSRHLERMQRCVLGAGTDRDACVRWQGVELRRYRDLLYLRRAPMPPPPEFTAVWDLPAPLALPWGRLSARPAEGAGLSVARLSGQAITVRLRRGGERCRPVGRAHSQTLKRLLQSHGVPAWERPRLPLVFVAEELSAVAGLWICGSYAAAGDEPAWQIVWEPELEGDPHGVVNGASP